MCLCGLPYVCMLVHKPCGGQRPMMDVFLKCSSSALTVIYFKVSNCEYMSARTLCLCCRSRQSLRHCTTWSCSYQWLWLLGTEPGSSKETLHALNHFANSLAPPPFLSLACDTQGSSCLHPTLIPVLGLQVPPLCPPLSHWIRTCVPMLTQQVLYPQSHLSHT